MKKPGDFVDTTNAREDDQRTVLKKINEEGYCPFCWKNFTKNHKKPIIRKGNYWFVTENQWPYDNSEIHLLFVLKNHIERLSELTQMEVVELFEFFSWAEDYYNIPGGGIGIRFGDTDFSGGTVKHLHAQLMVPKQKTERRGFVSFPIG